MMMRIAGKKTQYDLIKFSSLNYILLKDFVYNYSRVWINKDHTGKVFYVLQVVSSNYH